MKNFLDIPEERIIFKSEFFFIIYDLYPVSPGHLLIISTKPKNDFFSLVDDELRELNTVIIKAKELIEKDFSPDGYNIGMNCGAAAGQTVFHFHCHLIPRYLGDVENPAGGIRHCLPGKGYY